MRQSAEQCAKMIAAQYRQLTEARISTLVTDDKWMTRIEVAVQNELTRVLQTISGRIRELAERCPVLLPKIIGELATLQRQSNA